MTISQRVRTTRKALKEFKATCKTYREAGFTGYDPASTEDSLWLNDQLDFVLNGITDVRVHDNFIVLASKVKHGSL